MPVILENVSSPSPQDLEDLVKVYQDYPEVIADDLEQWISDKLAGGQTLFAGRFNGRLLAAVWGIPSFYCWQLEHLCVRALTRRRSVARQLLTLLAKEAQAQKLGLKIEDRIVPDTLCALLEDLGFSKSSDTVPCQGMLWSIDAPGSTQP